MRRFLSIGECMVEMAPAGDGRYAMSFAGDTFNTAWYARRTLPPETEVAYLTAVGNDLMSQQMTGFIEESGIVPEIRQVEGRTVGLYLVQLNEGERSFAYWRDTSAARCLARGLKTLPGVKGPKDIVYFSGITLAILPAEERQTLLDCISRARASGVTVAFDSNLRPRLWADADDMRDWVMRAAGISDIALPSFDDESVHFGDDDPEATADRYISAGAHTVIVKNGSGPVRGARKDRPAIDVEPLQVDKVVDTTAAGDSFNAAAIAALSSGEPFRDAIEAGCRLSAKVVGARGALVR